MGEFEHIFADVARFNAEMKKHDEIQAAMAENQDQRREDCGHDNFEHGVCTHCGELYANIFSEDIYQDDRMKAAMYTQKYGDV